MINFELFKEALSLTADVITVGSVLIRIAWEVYKAVRRRKGNNSITQ